MKVFIIIKNDIFIDDSGRVIHRFKGMFEEINRWSKRDRDFYCKNFIP